MIYLLINYKSHNGHSTEVLDKVKALYKKEKTTLVDIVREGPDYTNFLNSLHEDDICTLIGGDGTLNKFVNFIHNQKLPCKFYFYSAGTGNDFKNDVIDKVENDLIYVNDILNDLPYVLVNDQKYYFINNVGFGIDGYCCEVGDKLQAKSTKKISYTSIAIKGALGGYKLPNATVTVDGVEKKYKRVWLAPAMKGKYYGGGMKVAPDQDRFDPESLITSVVVHKVSRLRLLLIFPTIFKGTHVKYNKIIDIQKGHDIIVEFDRPTALQIDGETISGVLRYEAHIK